MITENCNETELLLGDWQGPVDSWFRTTSSEEEDFAIQSLKHFGFKVCTVWVVSNANPAQHRSIENNGLE